MPSPMVVIYEKPQAKFELKYLVIKQSIGKQRFMPSPRVKYKKPQLESELRYLAIKQSAGKRGSMPSSSVIVQSKNFNSTH